MTNTNCFACTQLTHNVLWPWGETLKFDRTRRTWKEKENEDCVLEMVEVCFLMSNRSLATKSQLATIRLPPSSTNQPKIKPNCLSRQQSTHTRTHTFKKGWEKINKNLQIPDGQWVAPKNGEKERKEKKSCEAKWESRCHTNTTAGARRPRQTEPDGGVRNRVTHTDKQQAWQTSPL